MASSFEWMGAEKIGSEILGTERFVYRFAAELKSKTDSSYEKGVLELRLQAPKPLRSIPRLKVRCVGKAVRKKIEKSAPDVFRVLIYVPDPPRKAEEDEVVFDVSGGKAIPPCTVVLRRSDCSISTALLTRGTSPGDLPAQTKAALLWRGWRRYSEIAGLKCFTSGLSGVNVFVLQPRLHTPAADEIKAIGTDAPDVVSEAWGSHLLVKTGKTKKIREEWDRFVLFLKDRLHPFMARSEEYLRVLPAGEHWEDEATMVSSFLGGDLLQVQSFESLVRGSSRPEEIEKVVRKVFAVMGSWYRDGVTDKLGNWKKKIQKGKNAQGQNNLVLFEKLDFKKEEDREGFYEPLLWDTAFAKEEHLSDHLLGKDQDGLLYKLLDFDLRYSLVHGDLHPKNILTDAVNPWILDFGETGMAPTLVDFAKLEVALREWCLDIDSATENIEEYAMEFETLLLDHFTNTEGGLERVRDLAPRLGVDPDELLKVARCIAEIRRCALPYCLRSPDRRDYSAVLYLTVLHTLKFAGGMPELVGNLRLLMSLFWVLEDRLSRMVGMKKPFDRQRAPLTAEGILRPRLLGAPGAPGRIAYLMSRSDGQKALGPLAATRGMLQGGKHHLDVFDHSLAALAYVEEILADPAGALLDPRALDDRVGESLDRQGVKLPRPAEYGKAQRGRVGDWVKPCADEIREPLIEYLDENRRLALKWSTLLHDVGKPATRVMTPGTKKRRGRSQFFSHERYGIRLVSDLLDQLFHDKNERNKERRRLAEDLVSKHHLQHRFIDHYEDSRKMEGLRALLQRSRKGRQEWNYLLPYFDKTKAEWDHDFPALILHGLADFLACRGPAKVTAGHIERLAEIGLALLTVSLNYPAFRHLVAMWDEFDERTKGFWPLLEKKLNKSNRKMSAKDRRLVLKKVLAELDDWFLAKTCPPGTTASPTAVPGRAVLLRRAASLLP